MLILKAWNMREQHARSALIKKRDLFLKNAKEYLPSFQADANNLEACLKLLKSQGTTEDNDDHHIHRRDKIERNNALAGSSNGILENNGKTEGCGLRKFDCFLTGLEINKLDDMSQSQTVLENCENLGNYEDFDRTSLEKRGLQSSTLSEESEISIKKLKRISSDNDSRCESDRDNDHIHNNAKLPKMIVHSSKIANDHSSYSMDSYLSRNEGDEVHGELDDSDEDIDETAIDWVVEDGDGDGYSDSDRYGSDTGVDAISSSNDSLAVVLGSSSGLSVYGTLDNRLLRRTIADLQSHLSKNWRQLQEWQVYEFRDLLIYSIE